MKGAKAGYWRLTVRQAFIISKPLILLAAERGFCGETWGLWPVLTTN